VSRTWTGLVATVLALACAGPPHAPDGAEHDAVLAAIDSMASAALDERRTPGLSVVVLQRDDTLLAKGYGFADEARRVPASATTVFQLGSISKQFLAALVLRLAERGELSLDGPVTRHLPEFARLPPAMLVRHLLNHTAGIREPFTLPEYQAGIEDLGRSAGEVVLILQRTPVDFSPGSRWSYSNANYMILALLAERVTGKPYEHALADEFFRPHGLSSLRACTPLPRERGEARGHVLQEGAVVPAAPENMNWIRGDGGLCGNAADVARWTRLLASGRIVTDESYREMVAPTRLADGRLADYGFGLSLVTLDGRHKVAHNGAMLGFSASAAYYPDSEHTVVVLTNRGGVRTESLERRMARCLLGLPAPELREQELQPEAKRRVSGRYDIGVFQVRVVERDGHLWLEMPPPGPTDKLRYLGAGEFACESDPDACRLTFSADDTAARELRLYMGAMHWYGVRVP
jgi:CubicO group peptidase (beta-lactamase class C family)